MSQYYLVDNIHNVTFDIVIQHVEKVLNERDDFCHCNICVLDLVAYVLNNVTPFYTTSLLGSFYPEKKIKIENEIDGVIEEGIKRIKLHPHHDSFTNNIKNNLYDGKNTINEGK